jgi:hypothetical protein
MSVNLKKFIVNEEIRSSHAVKYLDYQDNFHDDIKEDLVLLLSKEWKKQAIKFKNFEPNAERKEDMLLKNPDAFVSISFSDNECYVGYTRFNKQMLCPISIKISHAYSKDQRNQITKKFLEIAKSVFNKVIQKNEEAFSIKMASGNIKTLFNVKHLDDQTVKLQFKSIEKKKDETHRPEEVVKTIFMVGVEYGKERTKTKHFDRIFFIDYSK